MKLPNLSEVSTHCSKPACTHTDSKLARHHRKYESLIIGCFERQGGRRWLALSRRYYDFRPQDIVVLCEWHHREIHELYKVIVSKHVRKIGRRIQQWSWTEADILMKELDAVCKRWLKLITPGSPPWPVVVDK